MKFRLQSGLLLLAFCLGMQLGSRAAGAPAANPYVGSASCRECHEKFYQLWAPSHHGLAMQPWAIARTNLAPQTSAIKIGAEEFRTDITNGVVIGAGPQGEKRYRIEQALGGKNVMYFLTPFDRGRLQVLPVAFDLRRREWYDTAASAVRHLGNASDAPLHWTDSPYTFNTACYSCHVSQLTNNYTLKSDSYATSWGEPGINCETCHGPAGEHVRLARVANGQPLKELGLISTKQFSPQQMNSLCGPCHAKMHPLTDSFAPRDRYFDHFGLATLEQSDFYPDGRDLGENFTYTTWLLSPCVASGQLHCVKCHTSSGRYRFAGDNPNAACLPCHQGKVDNLPAHSHHKTAPGAPVCISCHMPMTEFARMRRSDHSMRPPMPAATLAFGSPNACNLCHTNKDAAWADRQVRKWHADDYQAPVLRQGSWIAQARKRDWSHLAEIVKYLSGSDRQEVWASSLIQLLRACDREEKWPGIKACLNDSSPLVRAAAVEAMGDQVRPDMLPALLTAVKDDYRIVRVRAASALAGVPRQTVPENDRPNLDRATRELLASFLARPDSSASYHNLGNFYLERRELPKAVEAFETAIRLMPEDVASRVNLSVAYNMSAQNDKAEASLRAALKLDPTNATVHLNLGMLLAEMDKMPEAEQAFRAALRNDPRSAQAAFNLGVLLAQSRPEEAIGLCARAAELRPEEPKYAYTLAFFQNQQGQADKAASTLEKLLLQKPAYADAYSLLAHIYEGQNKPGQAAAVCRQAAANVNLAEQERYRFAARARSLDGQ